MLWSFDELKGYGLRATDGTLGSVHDLLFDDAHWTARWLVVDTAWLFGRRVLLAPQALGHPDGVAREFPVALTQDQIKHAPDVDADRPVNRQHETDLYGYYGYGPYWTTMDNAMIGGVAGVTLPPRMPIGHPERMPATEEAEMRAAGAQYIDGRRPASAQRPRGHRLSYPRHRQFGRQRRRFPARRGGLGHPLSGRRYRPLAVRAQGAGRAALGQRGQLGDAGSPGDADARRRSRPAPNTIPIWRSTAIYEEQLHGHYGRPGYW